MKAKSLWSLFKLSSIKPLQSLIFRNYCGVNASSHTVSSLIDHWEEKFKSNDISEPDLSIRYIMVHVLNLPGINDLSSVTSTTLTSAQIAQLEKCCRCRLSRMPIQYIVGGWEFIDLNVRLKPPVFIPRPETEEFVNIIANEIKSSKVDAKILEIGCGSGVISLALLKNLPQIHCTAIDQSKFACELTLQNAKINNIDMNRLQVYQATLTGDGISDINFKRKFDFLVSNPPYISEKLLPTLSPEIILYEDIKALNGGDDGLQVIRYIINLAPKLLQSNGKLFLETDPEHPEMIRQHLTEIKSKLRVAEVHLDFTKRNRFVEITNG